MVVNLPNDDLPRVFNGLPGDDIKKRSFKHAFTKEIIKIMWDNVEFVPFTRQCPKSGRVRSELGQSKRDEKIEDLVKEYEKIKLNLENKGYNAEAFDAVVPGV